jgi:sigma54-dependent transcription regulator
MNTQKVDVLAVMNASSASFDNRRFEQRHANDRTSEAFWTGRIAEMIAARAAVADLIEAATITADLLDDETAYRLRIALSCIGGDK